MFKIKTEWAQSEKDKQATEQTFVDEAHYWEYHKIMKKRGFTGKILSAEDLNTGQLAVVKDGAVQVEKNKFVFNLGGINA